MTVDPLMSFTSRLPASILARLDALAAAMAEATPGMKVSRSDAMRVAVEGGLPDLEARYASGEKGPKPASKPAAKSTPSPNPKKSTTKKRTR
jgi:hypothetical protein